MSERLLADLESRLVQGEDVRATVGDAVFAAETVRGFLEDAAKRPYVASAVVSF